MKPFDEIILSRKEKRLLRKITKEEIPLEDPETKTTEFDVLIGYGMLQPTVSNKFPHEIDQYGIPIFNAYRVTGDVSRYWLYEKKRRSALRKEARRYWITTAIAIVALALAVLSLIWQMYTWTENKQEESESMGLKCTVADIAFDI